MVRAPAGSMVRGHVVRVTGDNRSFCGRAVRWVFDNLVLLLVFAVALYLIVHNGALPLWKEEEQGLAQAPAPEVLA